MGTSTPICPQENCNGELVWVTGGKEPGEDGVLCQDCGEWADFHVWTFEKAVRMFPNCDPYQTKEKPEDACPREDCSKLYHEGPCTDMDQIPSILVRKQDIEALFRDGAGNLVPPSGRTAQSTSQTNRVFALERLYRLVSNQGGANHG